MSEESEKKVNDGENEFAKQLEEMFKNRYSEEDEAFMETMKIDLPKPPCVENWFSRPKRSFDWARGGRGGGRGRDDGRNQCRQRDYDRNRDWHRDNHNRGRPGNYHGDRNFDSRRDHGHQGRERVFYPRSRQGGDRHSDHRHHPYRGQQRRDQHYSR